MATKLSEDAVQMLLSRNVTEEEIVTWMNSIAENSPDTRMRKFTLVEQLTMGDTTHSVNRHEVAWRNFQQLNLWTGDNSTIFCNNPAYQDFDHFKVIRKQTYPSCYMNAPALLLHYLIAINTNGADVSMVNVMRRKASELAGKEFWSFVEDLGGRGGDSAAYTLSLLREEDAEDFFEDPVPLALPDSMFLSSSAHNEVCEALIGRLAVEPALITKFKLREDFADPTQHAHDDVSSPLKDPIAMNAMLLVGARKAEQPDKSIKYFFLIQNTWMKKYFVEVSATYLFKSQPVILFVKHKVKRYKEGTPICVTDFAEAEDGAECGPPEGCKPLPNSEFAQLDKDLVERSAGNRPIVLCAQTEACPDARNLFDNIDDLQGLSQRCEERRGPAGAVRSH